MLHHHASCHAFHHIKHVYFIYVQYIREWRGSRWSSAKEVGVDQSLKRCRPPMVSKSSINGVGVFCQWCNVKTNSRLLFVETNLPCNKGKPQMYLALPWICKSFITWVLWVALSSEELIDNLIDILPILITSISTLLSIFIENA